MNPRQKLFCEYYCGKHFGNAYQAAVAAGYSEKYAAASSRKILENVGVQAYINELQRKPTQKRIATIEDIKAFWTEVMDDKSRATKDRLRAAELLAKAAGAFNNDW